jgi:branched-chain amino acid transport system substrate-binding protein
MVRKVERLMLAGILILALLIPVANAASQALPQVITFGAAAPFSGDQAIAGQFLKEGVDLAIEEINAAGGVQGHKLAVVYADDMADPKEGANVAQRFCSNSQIFAIIGHNNSSVTRAALPIYKGCGLTAISMWSNNPSLTKSGFTNFFRNIPSDDVQGPEMARVVVQRLGKKRFAVLYENTDYGTGLLKPLKEKAAALGATIVDETPYQPSVDKDFSTQITKIKDRKAEAIAILGNHPDAAAIARFAKRLGFNGPIVGSSGIAHDEFITLAGPAAEKVYTLSYFYPDPKNPAAIKFVKAFLAKYPKEKVEPAGTAAYPYEVVYIYKKAIEMGATKATLPTYLHKIKNFLGPTGRTTFDAGGDPVGKGQTLMQVQNGKWVALGG